MKVICIDASIGKKTGLIPPFKEGDILTVRQSKCYIDNWIVLEYELFPEGRPKSWYKSRFIPLSEIDEMELVNELTGNI